MSTATSDEYRSRLQQIRRDIEEFAELIAEIRAQHTRDAAAVPELPTAPPFATEQGAPIP